MKARIWAVGLAAMLVSVSAWAGSGLGPEHRALLARIQSMAHGYHSEAQWTAVLGELQEHRARSERAGNFEQVIELSIIEAMVYRDMWGEPDRARALLERTRDTYFGRPIPNVKRIYVNLAEAMAMQGDETGIARLIDEFRKSPHFDPETYPYRGGAGREDPLVVTRPRATGEDSVTVMTMERFRVRARFAPGNAMPDFEARDAAGRAVRLSDYRGRVVLVDFWLPQWPAWSRDLPNLISLHRRYQAEGFEVVGIYIGRDIRERDTFVRQQAMGWPQWTVDRRVPARFGLYGDVRNFLVDRDGVIIGVDLRGADLQATVRAALP